MTNPSTSVLPPVSNTGVEPSAVSVGWLAGTIRPTEPPDIEKLPFEVARLLSAGTSGGSQFGAPFQWYGKSLRAPDNGWSVGYEGVGDARGTVSVTLRQTAIDERPELVPLVLGLGLRASRVDLAADLHGNVARPRSYFDRRHLARTRTSVSRWRYLEDGDGLSSVTIGARSSERMARIYDKPLPDGGPRVRHELELKGSLAVAVCAALLAGATVVSLWHDQYGRLVQWV